jgi:hypothetical protein
MKCGARREFEQGPTAFHQNPELNINLGRAAFGEILMSTSGGLQGGILMLILGGLQERHTVQRGIWVPIRMFFTTEIRADSIGTRALTDETYF